MSQVLKEAWDSDASTISEAWVIALFGTILPGYQLASKAPALWVSQIW